MKSFVLRNKGQDQSLWWILAFMLAFVATLLASSYVLAMVLRAIVWMFSDDVSFGSIFIVPWYVWMPIAGMMAYISISGREWSVWGAFSQDPARLTNRILEILGASRALENTRDPLVRRFININEEIAIAAGCVPALPYVLQKDYSINALTVGSPTAGAVCVTRGALRTLKRAELQAVVAHEYGHVVNGDVGLNMRLLYWLGALLPYGFRQKRGVRWRVYAWFLGVGAVSLAIAGLFDAAGGVLEDIGPWFGMAAMFCGLVIIVRTITAIVVPVWRLGSNFTRMAHSGFTREREFEADGISAQLTRDPGSLASVLRKIAGLHMESALAPNHAAVVAHMCIASGLFGTDDDRFATHPTLEERLHALGHPLTPEEREQMSQDPQEAVERYAAEVNAELGVLHAAEPVVEPAFAPDADVPESAVPGATRSVPVDATFSAVPDIANAVRLLAQFPSEIRAALRTPDGASAAAHALVSDRVPPGATEQQQRLVRLFSETLVKLGEAHRLPLLELAIPTLRALPLVDRKAITASLRLHMESGKAVTLREFVYFLLLTQPLETTPRLASSMRPINAFTVLLGAAAYQLTGADAEARALFSARCAAHASRNELPPREQVTWPKVERALDRLRSLGPERDILLKALAGLIEHDGRIDIHEVEFLRAIALAIDRPMPPLAI